MLKKNIGILFLFSIAFLSNSISRIMAMDTPPAPFDPEAYALKQAQLIQDSHNPSNPSNGLANLASILASYATPPLDSLLPIKPENIKTVEKITEMLPYVDYVNGKPITKFAPATACELYRATLNNGDEIWAFSQTNSKQEKTITCSRFLSKESRTISIPNDCWDTLVKRATEDAFLNEIISFLPERPR